ncbi:MAG TPA: HAD family phosphatase [Bellilinea sp.]|nr:HAD family phosphatase [Bellilinea sp.]
MIKAVIFDMGGVLLRTIDQGPREALGARYGFDTQRLFDVVLTSESSKQAEVGLKPDKVHWEWALDELGIPQEERAEFIKEFWAGDRMDYELLDFIQSLRPAIRTGLLSNAWPNTRSNITRHWGALEPYFDVTIFSAELGMRKPAPEFFHWLLERLDVRPDEAIFVDDYGKNIEAARELGMQAVKFCSTEQAIQDVRALINHSVPGN